MIGSGRSLRGLGGERERLEALSTALKDVRFFFLVSLWWDTD
jgi:hypothetical protein